MLSRNLEKAKNAYRNKNVEDSIQAHHKLHTGAEQHKQEGRYIKSLIYGGIDGIITTFAVVAGVAGASLSAGIVLVMGFANLIADGLSMAIGDYLRTKAENEYKEAERQRELWEIYHYPEGEKQEMIELYMGKGISREDAIGITEILSRYNEAWADVMMVEELGFLENDESLLKNALITFLAFGICGFIPLAAYVVSKYVPAIESFTFYIACGLTALALFILGTLKVKITDRGWLLSGLETLIVGGIAASAAYTVGIVLSGLV